MSKSERKVVVVTGSSSGLGRLTAQTLAAEGHTVYATMRSPRGTNRPARDEILAFARREKADLEVLEIDVTDVPSIDRAVTTVLDRRDRIDVVVNNAGLMSVGAAEAFTVDEVRRQFDSDFFGAVSVNRAVLPQMRARRSGLLIQISAFAGRLVIPGLGIYSACKFAVEALAETYRHELSIFGVDSIIVEPGPFPTPLRDKSLRPKCDPERRAAYADVVSSTPDAVDRLLSSRSADGELPPKAVADAIATLVDTSAPRPLRTVVGEDYGISELNRAAQLLQRGILERLGSSPS